MPFFVYPLIVLGSLILILGIFALLARIQQGRFLRPVVNLLAKVPLFRRLMTKASAAALERQNPDLASALKKLERVGPTRDPLQAQRALSRLTPAEKQAYLAAIGDQQDQLPVGATNRAERRRLERMAQPTQRKSGGGGKRKRA